MKSIVWGNKDFRVTSPFGPRTVTVNGVVDTRFHTGVDIAHPIGTPLFAPEDCLVEDKTDKYGALYQSLKFKDGTQLLLVHLSSFVLSGNVRKGMKISLTGATGYVTAPHTHIELRTKYGQPATAIDPVSYLEGGVKMIDPKYLPNLFKYEGSDTVYFKIPNLTVFKEFFTDNTGGVKTIPVPNLKELNELKEVSEAVRKENLALRASLAECENDPTIILTEQENVLLRAYRRFKELFKKYVLD